MDRALAPTHLAAAFGVSLPKHLPGPDELGKLIADLEVQLVAGIANSGFRIDLSPIRKSAWYLHGIASTSDPARYPAEQRRRAFAVSSHVLDVLLEDPRASHRSRLVTAFAAQVGYHHADESPNATAVHRKLHLNLAEPAHFTEGAGVVLQAGIHFLALDTRTLSRHLGTWSRQVTELASAAELDTLDGTMFGPTERVLRGISDLAAFLREGDFELLDNARSHLLRVVQDDVGLSDLDTRWVAAHLLGVAEGLAETSVWAALPPTVPAAVKQAFTLDRNPVLSLWPPQRALIAHPTLSPLDPTTTRLLMSVPTSAGKTLLAQLIICAHMAHDDRDVCYVTPLRSLGREMRQALRSRLAFLNRRLGADLPDGLGEGTLSTDSATTKVDEDDVPRVEVMTPERLMNALRQSPESVLTRFGLFVVDEAHLIAQTGGRGLLLEGLLSLLDTSGAKLMLLSGVLGNATSLAAWASGGRGQVLFTDEWRAPRRLHVLMNTEKIPQSQTVIPGRGRSPAHARYDLRAHLAVRPTGSTVQRLATSDDTPIGQLFVRADNSRMSKSSTAYSMTAKTAALLLRAGSLLMVVSQRSTARDAAREMAAALDDDPRAQGLADALSARLGADHPLIGCVRKGVAYHHAGLPVEVQEAVEDAIRSETIRAVVATSTLTDGVNLPVRTVVIATTEYSGQDPRRRMTPGQLLNAVGRAGRAGKESEGWIVLALQKRLESGDFARLTPSPEELEVHSTLSSETALNALADAEALVAETQDAVLRLPPDSEADGFVSYVWFVLHALELVPTLTTRKWQDVVTRLFAFAELPEDLKARWLALAEKVAEQYARTEPASRHRWAQAGTSLRSAARIEALAATLADLVQQRDGWGELTLDDTQKLLEEANVYDQLLELPDAGKSWSFQVSPRGDHLLVTAGPVVRDWVAGGDLTDLAETHLPQVADRAFRLEQMVDGISEGVQHYLAWTVGMVIAQANEILTSRLCLHRLLPTTAAHLRYGVDTPLAIDLLVHDVKSRPIARELGRMADERGLDAEGLRDFLGDLHIRGWRQELGATPTDVLDLLQYIQGRDRHQLAALMEHGRATAEARLNDQVEPPGVATPVHLRLADGGDSLELHADDGALLGVIAARDHAGVAAIVESGLSVDLALQGNRVSIERRRE